MFECDVVEILADIWPETAGVLIFFGSMVVLCLVGKIINLMMIRIIRAKKRRG